ncbi:MAG: hypothetical protein KDC30_05500, partial [Saprospiraceae bacterium]|nr:hypothetical protein [Saprospiraceae bacterium]
DGNTEGHTVSVGARIEWGSLSAAQVTETGLQATENGEEWQHGGFSDNVLDPQVDAWLEFSVRSLVNQAYLGLAGETSELIPQLIAYGFRQNNTEVEVIHNGETMTAFGPIEAGDVLRIERGEHVAYFWNEEQVFDAEDFADGPLIPMGILQKYGDQVDGLVSFGCRSFYLEAEDDLTVLHLSGPGVEEDLPGAGPFRLEPELPPPGELSLVQLTVQHETAAGQADLWLEIDQQGRIVRFFGKKTDDEGQQHDVPVPRKFYLERSSRDLKFEAVAALIDWWNQLYWCDLINYWGYSGHTLEADRNWSYSIHFGDGNVRQEYITFFDNLGRPTQNQERLRVENRVLAQETIYDAFGRPVLRTLPAPASTSCVFFFDEDFITYGGMPYDYPDFDLAGSTLNNPHPVDGSSDLGKYYSHSSEEAYVSNNDFPYTRQDATLGGVRQISGTGEVMRMGTGHESSEASFVVLDELDHYIGFRNDYVQDGNNLTTLKYRAIKTVGVDENGRQAIRFSDLDGRPIASCLSGEPGASGFPVSGATSEDLGYTDIHLPEGLQQTLTFTGNLSRPIAIFDRQADQTSPVFSGTAGAFNASGNLPAGMYRILSTAAGHFRAVLNAGFFPNGTFPGAIPPRVYNPNDDWITVTVNGSSVNLGPYATSNTLGANAEVLSSEPFYVVFDDANGPGTVTAPARWQIPGVSFSYDLDYSFWTYRYFDKAGRLLAEIQPEGIDLNSNSLEMATEQEHHSWFRLRQDSPDEGRVEYVYRKDGRIRFSQDEEQAQAGKFSYIYYDEGSGRVVEMGIFDPNSSPGGSNWVFQDPADFDANPNPTAINWFTDDPNNGPLAFDASQQSYLAYDRADAGLSAVLAGAGVPLSQFRQTFLRGKLSKTWNANAATWYSYDELGRLRWTVKEIQGLGVFTVEYRYDFQGNLIESVQNRYRSGEAAYHRYVYDRDNRLVRGLFRTAPNLPWREQAEYDYYLHGPLKREEIAGNLQGIDYVYAKDGRLKSINHTKLNNLDPGKDGYNSSLGHQSFAKDAFGFSLDYYVDDYDRTGSSLAERTNMPGELYNGMIYSQRWQTRGKHNNAVQVYEFEFDYTYNLSLAELGTFANGNASLGNDYRVSYTYDRNGNLQSLQRNAYTAGSSSPNAPLMDQLTYQYYDNPNDPNYAPNRLRRVTDAVGGAYYGDELVNQTASNNYTYYRDGKLKIDEKENIKLEYDAYGMVSRVLNKTTGIPKIEFVYDEFGGRVAKRDRQQGAGQVLITWYVRDAGGMALSIYEQVQCVGDPMERSGGDEPIGCNPVSPHQTEVAIYAAGRVGVYYRQSAEYQYELSDHLGNVRAVIKGQKDAAGNAVIVAHADYYPFGERMPDRYSVAAHNYRFGYQGIELDPESGWSAFALRMYDARLGRWHNPDPKGQFHSPYLAMGNNPAMMV